MHPPSSVKQETSDQQTKGHTSGSMQVADPSLCTEMEIWDYSQARCTPLPHPNMPMRMYMIHANAFATYIKQQRPRGRDGFSAPNMFMGDVGTSIGSHYLNLNLMTTFEKWTFPSRGYPQLLQTGEHDETGNPYIDAQHPHSSPIMGLTLSDTIRLGAEKNFLKLFFAPRGQATDGPIAFMHRGSSLSNPDAPLGHHIGQDVAHISSTVVGATLGLGKLQLEGSIFNGREPEPDKVELPLGKLNSFAVRAGVEAFKQTQLLASFANVSEPEGDAPEIKLERRYSLSLYNQIPITGSLKLHNTLLFGYANRDEGTTRTSALEEFTLTGDGQRVFGRLESVSRSARELEIDLSDRKERAVVAGTLGYAHRIAATRWGELLAGGSITNTFLPTAYKSAYGGNPLSGKVFLQISAMQMGEL